MDNHKNQSISTQARRRARKKCVFGSITHTKSGVHTHRSAWNNRKQVKIKKKQKEFKPNDNHFISGVISLHPSASVLALFDSICMRAKCWVGLVKISVTRNKKCVWEHRTQKKTRRPKKLKKTRFVCLHFLLNALVGLETPSANTQIPVDVESANVANVQWQRRWKVHK